MQTKRYGLIGFPLSHSFSEQFFHNKFSVENISASYFNIELENISDIRNVISERRLNGFNVTIPHKENILNYLDEITSEAAEIGAVNTVRCDSGKLIGYNTDHLGFSESLLRLIEVGAVNTALVLGSGGASKAIVYALKKLGINSTVISRTGKITFRDLNRELLCAHNIIVNATPLGTFPKTHEFPEIPYEFLNSDHLLYDLVYNPEKSLFLTKGEIMGCQIKNGLEMLERQAEWSWKIWNQPE